MEFLNRLYLRSPDEREDIIMFGREPGQFARDMAHGVARVGGPLREPNYIQAYVYAASILLEKGQSDASLDEIALPAFYLQRHAAELLLKRVFRLLLDICVYRSRDLQSAPFYSTAEENRLRSSHNLSHLHLDILDIARRLQLGVPPIELRTLVDLLTTVEQTATWPRYSTSMEPKTRTVLHHMENEVQVPLRRIQDGLDAAIRATAYSSGGDSTYEYLLYEEWLSYARNFGEAG